MDKYGRAIRDIREKNHDTREDLAKKLKLSESALGKYERGERAIKPDLLEKIAEIYDISVNYFFNNSMVFTQGEKEFLGEENHSFEALKRKYILESVDGKPLTEDEFTELEMQLRLYRIRKQIEGS